MPEPEPLIIHIQWPDKTQQELKVEDRLTFGRTKDNSCRIKDAYLSRRHAEIVRVGAHWHLRELDAKNPIRIDHDGQSYELRARNACVLEPGLQFTLGRLQCTVRSDPTELSDTVDLGVVDRTDRAGTGGDATDDVGTEALGEASGEAGVSPDVGEESPGGVTDGATGDGNPEDGDSGAEPAPSDSVSTASRATRSGSESGLDTHVTVCVEFPFKPAGSRDDPEKGPAGISEATVRMDSPAKRPPAEDEDDRTRPGPGLGKGKD